MAETYEELIDETYAGSMMSQLALSLAYVSVGLALLMVGGSEFRNVTFMSGALIDANDGEEVLWTRHPTFWFYVHSLAVALVAYSASIPIVYWLLRQGEQDALKLQNPCRNVPAHELSYVGSSGGLATNLGIGAGLVSLAMVAISLASPSVQLQAGRESAIVGVVLGALLLLPALVFVMQLRHLYGQVLSGKLQLRVKARTRSLQIMSRLALVVFPLLLGLLLILSLWPEILAVLTGAEMASEPT